MYKSDQQISGFYKSLNILCVEDELDVLKTYKDIFSNMFKKVYTAKNGNEGLEVFKNEFIDIVLTDQVMPECTGLEMSKNIRSIDHSIPIILVTALNNSSLLKEALDIHITSFLNKPFTKESLLNVFNLAVKSVIADKLMQKEQDFTIKNLTKSVNYNAYQEKLSFEKETTIAQNDIKPENVLDKFRCDVHYQPLDILSGDSYLIRKLNETQTFVFLVDGMGKGISASLSAMISSACINYYIDNVNSKEDQFKFSSFLKYTFAFLQPTLLEDEVISAHFLLFDKNSEKLKYAIFSMPPIVCISTKNELSKIKSNNPPISKYWNSFNINEISLKNIDKVLIHSDGLNENSVKGSENTYGFYLQKDFLDSKDQKAFKEKIQDKIATIEDDITYIYLKRLSN